MNQTLKSFPCSLSWKQYHGSFVLFYLKPYAVYTVPALEISMAVSTKDRVRKHRALQKERDLQIAVGAARLVQGQDPGDARKALAAFLQKVASSEGIPEDYEELLESSADKLLRKGRRL